ncbi:MAG TPA: hypothetical protein VEA41_05810 [Salinarimonas sp.]|nr:hypothetical protein [Salinarimonas sp.]
MIDWPSMTAEGAVLAFFREAAKRTALPGTLAHDPELPRGGKSPSEGDWEQLAAIVRHRPREEDSAELTAAKEARFKMGLRVIALQKGGTLGSVWDRSSPDGDEQRADDVPIHAVARQMGITVRHALAVKRDCLAEVAENMGLLKSRRD